MTEQRLSEQLETALAELIIEFEDMMGYVDDYFLDKWGYRDALERARAVLAEYRRIREGREG